MPLNTLQKLSNEGALAVGRHLAIAIDVTNVMQTVSHYTKPHITLVRR